MAVEQIPVAQRAANIEYAIRDVVVPATILEQQGHEIIKLNMVIRLHIQDYQLHNIW